MSREQVIYLINMAVQCAVWGMFSATLAFLDIGLGARYYSATLILSCLISCVYAYISADIKKKKWVFKHFKAIDLGETIFFTITETTFFVVYKVGKFDAIADMPRVLKLFFVWTVFYQIVRALISLILPGIGDVFEQSLYKNQIDYQNHSNAERLMSNGGAVLGAVLSFAVGDYFKFHPYWVFAMQAMDWIDLWARWQFYYKKNNSEIIKKNFAKDCVKWKSA